MEAITPDTPLSLAALVALPQLLDKKSLVSKPLVRNATTIQFGQGNSSPTDWEISKFNSLNSLNMPELLKTLETDFSNENNSEKYLANFITRLNNYNNQIQRQSTTSPPIKHPNGKVAVLINVDRIVYAINVVFYYKLPIAVGDLAQTGQIRDAAYYLATKLSSNRKYHNIISKILMECRYYNITSKRQIAYILSTAEHESGFMPIMEHSTSQTFTFGAELAAYYFKRGKNKASYNDNVNGNVKAGDSLIQRHIQLSQEERDALNGTQDYPKTIIEKLIEKGKITEKDIMNCDFYRYAGKGFVQLTWRDNYNKFGKDSNINRDLVTNPELALDVDIAIKCLVLGMTSIGFTGKLLKEFLDDDKLVFWTKARIVVNRQDKATDIANSAKVYYRNMKGK